MRPSFTGIGACLDNAYIESFFATLEKELVYQPSFTTREEARLAVSEFINMYYNSWQLHSSPGYRCPNDFEAQGLERLAPELKFCVRSTLTNSNYLLARLAAQGCPPDKLTITLSPA